MKSILSCCKKNPFSVVLFYVDVSPHQLIDILLSVNHPVLIFKSRRASRLRCDEQEAACLVAALAARPPGRPSLTVTNTQNICCVGPFDLQTHGTSLCVGSQSNEPQRRLMDKQNFNRLTTSKSVYFTLIG